MNSRRALATVVLLLLALGTAPPGRAGEGGPAGSVDPTPPRLSYLHGQVSFWRPGAEDWAAAQPNIPLAPGDELYTGPEASLELQIGPRAYARAWASTAIGLAGHDPGHLQLKVTAGIAALDLRALAPGSTVELSTPGAAFTVERPGYYRVTVAGERTAFVARRGGWATAVPAGGEPVRVDPEQELVVDGDRILTAAAPGADAWDQWNHARSEALAAAVSTRYLPEDVYGQADLDRHGTWQVIETYGPVWTPRHAPSGWAPYSTGTWIRDPYYGWTWVDAAPWGWAPYHYGRWVLVRGVWAWAPGPRVVRPVYAPALVVFFGPPAHVAVRPVVGWCALGWGEPVIPWWGGWGGPRVVNKVVVHHTTVIHAHNVTVYDHARVKHAVVTVKADDFGGRHVHHARVAAADRGEIRPVAGPPVARVTAASHVPETRAEVRPARDLTVRPVVTRRERDGRREAPHAGVPAQAPRRESRPDRPDAPAVTPAPAPRAQPDADTRREATPARPPRREREDRARPSPPSGSATPRPAPPVAAPTPPPAAPPAIVAPPEPRPAAPRERDASRERDRRRPDAEPGERRDVPAGPSSPERPRPDVRAQEPVRRGQPPPAPRVEVPRAPGGDWRRHVPPEVSVPPERPQVRATPAVAPPERQVTAPQRRTPELRALPDLGGRGRGSAGRPAADARDAAERQARQARRAAAADR